MCSHIGRAELELADGRDPDDGFAGVVRACEVDLG
jgi:hypothetical protein